MGVIPSGQENHSGAEHLNFPGGELNVIFLQSNISLRKKEQYFSLCFWFTPETEKQDGNKFIILN